MTDMVQFVFCEYIQALVLGLAAALASPLVHAVSGQCMAYALISCSSFLPLKRFLIFLKLSHAFKYLLYFAQFF